MEKNQKNNSQDFDFSVVEDKIQQVQNIIEKAVKSKDFQEMSQSVTQMVNKTLDQYKKEHPEMGKTREKPQADHRSDRESGSAANGEKLQMLYMKPTGEKVRSILLAVFGGKTVIILIYSTHDIELDQAGSLHLLIIDGTFGIFCKIAYIYGPGSVIGGKKRLYLIQKVVHAGIRIVCESASAGWRKSSFFLSGRRTVLAARSFGRIGGCRCICGFFLCGRTLDLS